MMGEPSMRFMVFLAALHFSAATAFAQQGEGFAWKQNDQLAPPNPAQASEDGFGVLMLVTDDPESFMKAWQGPTPPQVSTTDQVTRGKLIETMLIFSGCRAAENGNCNVSVELSVTGPDGAPYGKTFNGPIWEGPPPPQYNLQLGQSGLGFILEPEDKLGIYKLKANVTDHVAGTTLRVQQAITATDSK
jgi:hypothetical protein